MQNEVKTKTHLKDHHHLITFFPFSWIMNTMSTLEQGWTTISHQIFKLYSELLQCLQRWWNFFTNYIDPICIFCQALLKKVNFSEWLSFSEQLSMQILLLLDRLMDGGRAGNCILLTSSLLKSLLIDSTHDRLLA